MSSAALNLIQTEQAAQVARWRDIEARSLQSFTQAEIQLINDNYSINYTSQGDVQLTALAQTGDRVGSPLNPIVAIPSTTVTATALLPNITVPSLTTMALPNITLPTVPSQLNIGGSVSVPTSIGNIEGSIQTTLGSGGVTSIQGSVGSIVSGVQNTAGGLVSGVQGQVQGIVGSAQASLQNAVGNALAGTLGSLQGSVNVAGNVGGVNIGASVQGGLGGVTGNIGTSVQGALGGAVAGVQGQVQGVVGGAVAGVQGAAASAVGAAQGAVAGAVGAVQGAIGNALGTVQGALGSITGRIQGVLSSVGQIKGIISAIKVGYADGILGAELNIISGINKASKAIIRPCIGGLEKFVGTGGGTGVNLKALVNLSKSPSCSGVPGGFPALSIRLGTSAAQEMVEQALETPPEQMTAAEQSAAAKGGGCGGRRARAETIYKGLRPMPVTTIINWERRNQALRQAGIVETDDLPPTNVTIADWTAAVESYMPVIEAYDAKKALNTQISQSLSL